MTTNTLDSWLHVQMFSLIVKPVDPVQMWQHHEASEAVRNICICPNIFPLKWNQSNSFDFILTLYVISWSLNHTYQYPTCLTGCLSVSLSMNKRVWSSRLGFQTCTHHLARTMYLWDFLHKGVKVTTTASRGGGSPAGGWVCSAFQSQFCYCHMP